MRRVLLIAFMLGLVSAAAAQTSNTAASGAGECKLKLAQAPSIRGVRLGMTANEVFALFPGSEKSEAIRRMVSNQRFGMSYANIVPSIYESKDRFAGVRSVDFGFLDGELNWFALDYNSPEWKSDEQFASKVAESLNLPGVESWKRRLGMTLACDGFEVNVQSTPHNGATLIKVTNLEKDANRIFRERQEAVKDEARRAFKP